MSVLLAAMEMKDVLLVMVGDASFTLLATPFSPTFPSDLTAEHFSMLANAPFPLPSRSHPS